MSFLLVLKAGNKNYASFWNFLWTMSAVIWLFFDHNLVFSRALDTRFICRRKIAKVCVLSVCIFQKRHEFHNTYHVVTPYNIPNGLGVSLKWPGKIILSWLNIDTSSPHVLISYFFWGSSNSVACYWLSTVNYCNKQLCRWWYKVSGSASALEIS